ncbi:hypothetical protein EDB84DRAFT_1497684, partial [Lactarius hengduanensis]
MMEDHSGPLTLAVFPLTLLPHSRYPPHLPSLAGTHRPPHCTRQHTSLTASAIPALRGWCTQPPLPAAAVPTWLHKDLDKFFFLPFSFHLTSSRCRTTAATTPLPSPSLAHRPALLVTATPLVARHRIDPVPSPTHRRTDPMMPHCQVIAPAASTATPPLHPDAVMLWVWHRTTRLPRG